MQDYDNEFEEKDWLEKEEAKHEARNIIKAFIKTENEAE